MTDSWVLTSPNVYVAHFDTRARRNDAFNSNERDLDPIPVTRRRSERNLVLLQDSRESLPHMF